MTNAPHRHFHTLPDVRTSPVNTEVSANTKIASILNVLAIRLVFSLTQQQLTDVKANNV